jgi:hypothetical protein
MKMKSLLLIGLLTFFIEKINKVRENFPSASSLHPLSDTQQSPGTLLSSFRILDDEQVASLIAASPTKSCLLDPLPTWLLKQCPAAVQVITHVINSSLQSGSVPQSQKTALVRPLLKKPSLDHNEYKNYRPVSNLTFTSKLTEKAVLEQLKDLCVANGAVNQLQSAYRSGHSTETALVRVQCDLLRAVDDQGGAMLILLDLSAAFDTIDHAMMLEILEKRVGVTGLPLDWFKSYLSDRKQSVVVGEGRSIPTDLCYGVPQGSVLGPSLFTLYTLPLGDVISDAGLCYHMYADDTQVYLPVNPKSATSIDNMATVLHDGTLMISEWMKKHFLKLNADKTEVLMICRPSPNTRSISAVDIFGTSITCSTSARNLGVIFDQTLSMKDQVASICKRAYYQLHLIHQVRKSISEDAARTLVQSNVTSLLDYCNALLAGLPAQLIERLQKVQNCAARIVKKAERRCHVTPLLMELHWLPVKFRICYKVNILTFKAIHGQAPAYLSDLVQPYHPSRNLRSGSRNLLTVPTSKLRTVGERAFSSQAAFLWNNLPVQLRSIDDFCDFKKCLKTHYFQVAFY